MRAGQRLASASVAVCAAALLIAPAGASAAKTVYSQKKDARTFAQSDGHWKGGTSYSGLCVPGLTCPNVTNTFEASDGAGGSGDGHLRTSIGGLAGVISTSTGTYTSPAFKYNGVSGAKAKKVAFSMTRDSDLTPLLAVIGNSATYDVDLLDKSNGKSTSLIKDKALEDTNGWDKVPTVKVKPSKLKMGHSYKLRITSEFVTGVQVVDGGFADYDNVKLVAKGPKASTGGPGKGPIGGGIKPVKTDRNGRRIKVPYRCPGSTKPSACDAKLSVSLTRNGKMVTHNRTVRVRPAHHRVAELKVKSGSRAKVAKRDKVFVHARVRAKGHVYNVTRKVTVRRHH